MARRLRVKLKPAVLREAAKGTGIRPGLGVPVSTEQKRLSKRHPYGRVR